MWLRPKTHPQAHLGLLDFVITIPRTLLVAVTVQAAMLRPLTKANPETVTIENLAMAKTPKK